MLSAQRGVGGAASRPDRYGPANVRRGPVGRAVGVAVGLAVAVGVAALAWTASRPDVDAGVTAFRTVSDHRVDVTFEVRKPADRPALCVVRARDRHGAQTGYAQVRIGPARSSTVTVTKRLPTRERATTGEVGGCRLTGG